MSLREKAKHDDVISHPIFHYVKTQKRVHLVIIFRHKIQKLRTKSEIVEMSAPCIINVIEKLKGQYRHDQQGMESEC